MPGLRQSESEKTFDLIEDVVLEELADELDEEQPARASRRTVSSGEYFRKIEMLMEQKRLKEDLSDYDWDDF